MQRSLLKIFDRGIEFLFYGLIFLVPIVFAGSTSELFEFNKMWLTFAITSLIVFFWIGKMILKKEFRIQRTPLDIPIFLFLISQIVSTVFSMDPHISLWGYYSRFNGGLLSFVAYVILYYAFASNFIPQGENNSSNKNKFKSNISAILDQKIVRRMILVGIASGVFISLWGLPSHFGYDPTCLVFRGSFDVACWTADFQPKVRIFSTMGQPDWLAAILTILLPISIAYCLKLFDRAKALTEKENIKSFIFGGISILFYVDLLFTRAKSGFIAFWVSILVFVSLIVWQKHKEGLNLKKIALSKTFSLIAILLIITFFLGSSIGTIDKFTFPNIVSQITTATKTSTTTATPIPATPAPSPATPVAGELGGTDSGTIRLIVWEGALDAWKNNPIFGTGVETFAFAYYKYRPPQHNLTSEWNFLYNKAHNEFLNLMATTGTFGIVTYLSLLILFLWLVGAAMSPKIKNKSSLVLAKIRVNSFPYFEENSILIFALTSSFVSIIVTNFFGFSVVITNIYLFLIPLFSIILLGAIDPNYSIGKYNTGDAKASTVRWIALLATAIPTIYILIFLVNSWRADNSYALGQNLDQAGVYQKAYQPLHDAVKLRADEPVFKNEMANNDAMLASVFIQQSQQATDPKTKQQNQAIAQSLAQEAIATINDITTNYPNNILFWKTKVRIFYTLAQIDQTYLPSALQAIQKTAALAPTDASTQYNLGVLTGQSGDSKKATEILEYTIKIRPIYYDAYYALGLFYRDLAIDKKTQKVINQNYQTKAEDQMNHLLTLDPNNQRAKDSLSAWTGNK